MTRKKVSPYCCKRIIGCLLFLHALLAIPPRALPQQFSKQSQASQPNRAGVRPDSTVISVGNIIMWVYADGKTAREPMVRMLGDGARFPDIFYGGPIIYQDGVQWAGLVRDGADTLLRAGGQEYEVGTQPGRILSPGRAENPADPNVNRIWRIRRDYLSLQGQSSELQREAAILAGKNWFEVTSEEMYEVFNRYQRDWNEWPWQKGAPFYDTGIDGMFDEDEPGYDALTNPDPHQDNFPRGSERDGIKQAEEEPGIANADQVVWFVCNDVDDRVSRQLVASPPIGLEMQATLWAYRRFDPLSLSNLIFKRYLITYKGLASTPANARIDSMYLAQWSDPDIGVSNDDFIGCDPSLDLGYAYNADGDDRIFSNFSIPPPAAGYVLLSGPLVPEPGSTAFFGLRKKDGFRNLPMTSFNVRTGSLAIEDPCRCYQLTFDLWNLIRGFQKRPTYPPQPWRDPDGNPTPFVYSGDPLRRQGWTDDLPPGDRRFLLSSGPFSMALGDANEIVLAVAAGLSATNLSSISLLKAYARDARNGIQNQFIFPEPPATPKITTTATDGKVLFNWGDDQTSVWRTENRTPAGFQFEGYNLYELPSRDAQFSDAVKIATFDRVNEVRTIIDEALDPQTGLLTPRIVQIGTNSGIQYSRVISGSQFNDFYRIVNGREYTFALTAYNYNANQPFGIVSLESAPSIVTVVPQSLKPGVRWQSDMGDTLAVAHMQGNGEGRVVVVVVDPSKMTGDEYHVTFGRNAHDQTIWNLRNHTKDIDLLTGMTNQSGGNDYLIVEGVQTIVIDSVGIKGWSVPAGLRFWSWVGGDGFHLEGFNGAMGWGGTYPFNPSSMLPSEMVDVLFILAETDGDGIPVNAGDPNYSYAYRFLQNAQAPPAKQEFAPHLVNTGGDFVFQDFKKSVPWAAYEYDRAGGQIGKRLSIGFLENNVPAGRVDGRWWPPLFNENNNTDAQGPREWFWIFNKDYSETPDQLLASPTSSMSSTVAKPILLWGTVTRRNPNPVQGDNRLAIFAHRPNGPDDEFVFRTAAPIYDNALAKEDVLRLVKVYPNPYNGHLPDEVDLNQRVVTFTHLPAKATIRIFNLGGELVGVIRKDDDSQFARWNLLNQSGRLAASGMYIAHIEMPDVGANKVLKLAIIQP